MLQLFPDILSFLAPNSDAKHSDPSQISSNSVRLQQNPQNTSLDYQNIQILSEFISNPVFCSLTGTEITINNDENSIFRKDFHDIITRTLRAKEEEAKQRRNGKKVSGGIGELDSNNQHGEGPNERTAEEILSLNLAALTPRYLSLSGILGILGLVGLVGLVGLP